MWNENYENSPPLQWQVTGEGQRYITMWKGKNSRLVTDWINNSYCSISKADFYEALEDKVTPAWKNSSVSFDYGKARVAEYFIFLLNIPLSKNRTGYRKKRNINTQSHNEVTSTKKLHSKIFSYDCLKMKWRTIILHSVVWSKSNSAVHWRALQIKWKEGTCDLISWLILSDNLTERWPTVMWNSKEPVGFFLDSKQRQL